MSASESRRTDARSQANIRALDTIGQLIQRCQSIAAAIEVEDETSKGELLDALSIAELSRMRLLVEEDPDEIVL